GWWRSGGRPRSQRPGTTTCTFSRSWSRRRSASRAVRGWRESGRSAGEFLPVAPSPRAAQAPSRPQFALACRRMGTVYAIANQKGGVGKTTTAVNVAACIAEAGYGTLLVDVDPQANATVGLGVSRTQSPGLYEALTGEASATEALTDTSIAGLQMLPAGAGLAGANVEL